MTLEEKAEQYAQNLEKDLMKEYEEHPEYGQTPYLATIPTPHAKQAYIAGAKENGIVWHNLVENPKDLPKGKCTAIDFDGNKSIPVLNQDGEKVYFHKKDKRFKTFTGACYAYVAAWCKVPQFKG